MCLFLESQTGFSLAFRMSTLIALLDSHVCSVSTLRPLFRVSLNVFQRQRQHK